MASKRNRALRILAQRQFNRIARPSIKLSEFWDGVKTLSANDAEKIIECLRTDTGDAEIGAIIKAAVYDRLREEIERKLKDRYLQKDIPPEDLIEIL